MHIRLLPLLAALALAACSLPQLGGQPAPTAIPEATALPVATVVAAAPTAPAVEPSPIDLLPQPTAQADATPLPASPVPAAEAGQDDELAALAAARPGDRDQTTLVEAFKDVGDLPDVARTQPLEVQVGDVESFWVTDAIDDTYYTVTAKLRYAGPVVLMYVDTAVEADIDQADIERSAKEFEQRIYPFNRKLFGEERAPGIDGDPRLTVLNTPVRGAGGYFSSADAVVKAVNRFSNEREMFVIAIDSYPIGTDQYASTLAHEFQHMIEWNEQRRSPSWFNEGMSGLSEDLNGFVSQGTPSLHLSDPDVQLNAWSGDAAQTGKHYGTSQLFMRYFYEQYVGESGSLAELIIGDAGNNPELFAEVAARKRPEISSFADLVSDWAVANIINDPDLEGGRYSYELLPGAAALSEVQAGEVITSVSQFGADYLGVLRGPATLTFDGAEAVPLVGTQPTEGGFAWWSNRGDDGVQTLTREFDLTSVQQATLEFSTWYEIELNWDYAFVAVSTNGGSTWTTLEGTTTTNDDPQGANFGNGITGVSGAPGQEPDKGTRGKWVEERMDLTPFAGQRVLLRFWMVNDASYNAQGMLIDNIRIPELNYSDGAEAGDGGWQAQGFARTDAELPQSWALRLVLRQGEALSVQAVELDEQGRATISVPEGARGALAVIGTTPFTTERAQYTYSTK